MIELPTYLNFIHSFAFLLLDSVDVLLVVQAPEVVHAYVHTFSSFFTSLPTCSQTDKRSINHILSYTFRDSAPSERSRMTYLLADIQPVERFFYFFFFPPATSSFIPSKACLYFRLNSSLALPTFVSSTAIFLPIRSLLTTSSLNHPAWRCV